MVPEESTRRMRLFLGIGDVEIAGSVNRHPLGPPSNALDRRAAVSAETPFPGARDGGDDPGGIHPADAVVVGIGDVDITGAIHRHPFRDRPTAW